MDNGKIIKEMDEENKFGRMVHFIRVIGNKTWQMDKADSFNLEEMYIKVNG
jgi:hypothetical protein